MTAHTAAADDDIVDAEVIEDTPANDDPTKKTAGTAPTQPVAVKTSWLTRTAAKIRDSITNWWGYSAQPMSFQEAWKRSGRIEPRRIPGNSQLLAFAWHWSNRTDRVLLFALIYLLAPGWAVGPLLFIAVRPSRRWGLYIIAVAVLSVIPALAKAS